MATGWFDDRKKILSDGTRCGSIQCDLEQACHYERIEEALNLS